MAKNLSDMMNSEIVVPEQDGFLVVTNFAYSETRAGEPINTYSGLTDEAFNYLLEETTEHMDAEVMFCDGNTGIIQGKQESLKLLQLLCGERFSYAYCNKVAAEQVMDRCIRAIAETPEEREAHMVSGTDYVSHLN